jgi:protein-S-isoprenylcysteine O-methyltransferase Ste14
MSGRRTNLVVSALSWVGFNAVTLWAVAFLAGVGLPRTVDGPHRVGAISALAVDLALLLLFAAQHSVMARRSVKAWLRRRIPASLERTTYVLATDVCLALLFLLWEPLGGTVWDVDGAAAWVLWALCATGWALAVAATFAVDHLELTGLRQAGWGCPVEPVPGLQTSGLYAVVRHPLMTGLLVAFWATPSMSVSHLLFAAASTGYVLVGMAFEERDLRRTFGAAYDDYAARVPALVPGVVLPRRPVRVGQDA